MELLNGFMVDSTAMVTRISQQTKLINKNRQIHFGDGISYRHDSSLLSRYKQRTINLSSSGRSENFGQRFRWRTLKTFVIVIFFKLVNLVQVLYKI